MQPHNHQKISSEPQLRRQTGGRIALLLLSLLVVRCGGEERGPLATGTWMLPTAMLDSLAVSPVSPTITKGATQQFKATGTMSDGSTQDLTSLVTWTMIDIAPAVGVATVSTSGLATAKQVGLAVVMAQYMGLTNAILLTVKAPAPAGWKAQASGAVSDLHNIWGVDAANVWAVGGYGTIVRWNGTAWTAQVTGTSEDLFGVWGTNASNVWAVGDRGTILKWDGTSWTAQASGTTKALYGIWGSDVNNIWAAGAFGVILNGDYEPSIRTYTDLRMEMSCGLPPSPTSVMIRTFTSVMSGHGAQSDTCACPPTCKLQTGCRSTHRLRLSNNTACFMV